MTTEPKRGRGRPKKETYATIEAPVEKAVPAEPIRDTSVEVELGIRYTGTIMIKPDNPVLADRAVGWFNYEDDKIELGLSPTGVPSWQEFSALFNVGIYKYTDVQTGTTVQMNKSEDAHQWVENIEKAQFSVPQGTFYIAELARIYKQA